MVLTQTPIAKYTEFLSPLCSDATLMEVLVALVVLVARWPASFLWPCWSPSWSSWWCNLVPRLSLFLRRKPGNEATGGVGGPPPGPPSPRGPGGSGGLLPGPLDAGGPSLSGPPPLMPPRPPPPGLPMPPPPRCKYTYMHIIFSYSGSSYLARVPVHEI